jgi:hypothetical protein
MPVFAVWILLIHSGVAREPDMWKGRSPILSIRPVGKIPFQSMIYSENNTGKGYSYQFDRLYLQEKEEINDSFQVDFRPFKGMEPEIHVIRKKHLFILGGAVFSSWVAFVLRKKANDSYEQYARARSQRDIQKFWDQTRKYDLWANISLGVSGILSVYLFSNLIK